MLSPIYSRMTILPLVSTSLNLLILMANGIQRTMTISACSAISKDQQRRRMISPFSSSSHSKVKSSSFSWLPKLIFGRMETSTLSRWSSSIDQRAHALLFRPSKSMANLKYPCILERRSYNGNVTLFDDCDRSNLCWIYDPAHCCRHTLCAVAMLYPGKSEG